MRITQLLLALVYLIIFHSHDAFSQAPVFGWANQIGGPGNEIGYSMVVDGAGNVYTTGKFQSTIDFDPGPATFYLSATGNEDIFVTKVNNAGNFIWACRMGGSYSEWGISITISPTGHLYVTGQFENTADFDPGIGLYNMTSGGLTDIFVVKLDTASNFVWAKKFGGPGTQTGESIHVDLFGNVIIGGYFNGTVDFNPDTTVFSVTTAGNYDGFIAKLNSLGNFIWVKTFSGPTPQHLFNIALDAGGNIYATGMFYDNMDVNPDTLIIDSISTPSRPNLYVVCLNSAGIFEWARFLSSSSSSAGLGLTVDQSGYITVVGEFNGTVDFDFGPGTYNLTSGQYGSCYALRLDPLGNFLWAKKWNGNNTINMHDVHVANGNTYMTGKFRGTCDFDPGPGVFNLTSLGDYEIYVTKLDVNGNFLFAQRIGDTGVDVGYDIATFSNEILVTGGFSSIVDFNPGLPVYTMSSGGSYDYFLFKWSDCSIYLMPLSVWGPTDICLGDSVQFSGDQSANNWQWNRNGIAIPGATNVNYTAYTRGRYTCTSQYPGTCSVTSNSVLVRVICFPPDPPVDKVALLPDENAHFEIYPNPGTGIFNVISSPGKLNISNQLGEVVFLAEMEDAETTINLLNISPGIYFAAFKTARGNLYQKLIISK